MAESFDKGHGRIERRRLQATERLRGYLDWPGARTVCRIERETVRGGKRTVEAEVAVTSLSLEDASADDLLALWRGHWTIENGLHWVRDVTFDEDRCRVRSGSAPQALAACRNAAIAIVRTDGEASVAAATRRYAWRAAAAVDRVTAGR